MFGTLIHMCYVWYQVTPPDAATKWRRPEALHCAIPGTYITSTHSQSNVRILELFFHDNVTYQWLLTWLQRPAKMYLPNICRIRKNCFKTDELWGARHAATIALARYYVQVNGAAELVAHARRTLVLNRLFNGRTKCSPRRQKLQISPNCC